jgi:hypothetical protein
MKLGIDLSDRGIQQAILCLNTKSTEKLQE